MSGLTPAMATTDFAEALEAFQRDGTQTISFWIPVDPVTTATLRLIAVSHRWDRQVRPVRWVGDDVRYAERPGRTSPPYPGHAMVGGQRLREDWFPVIHS